MDPTIPTHCGEGYRSVPMPATLLTNRVCGDIMNDELEGIRGGRVPCDLSQQQLECDAFEKQLPVGLGLPHLTAFHWIVVVGDDEAV